MRAERTEIQFRGTTTPRTVITSKMMEISQAVDSPTKLLMSQCQNFMIPETGYMKTSYMLNLSWAVWFKA